MALESQDRPDYKNTAYVSMSRGWKTVRDVAAGTLAVRDCGKEYLPRFPAEHKDSYQERLKSATLFNAYARTVQALVGMIFKKNPVLSEDVPAVIRGDADSPVEGHAENIDLAGTHFDVFAREVVESAFAGHCFVLVDMQNPLADGATRADELRANLRPYWVKYEAARALNFRAVKINGQLEIGQITFEERSGAPAGRFGEREVLRYRTFMLEPVAAGEFAVRWEVRERVRDEHGEDAFPIVEGPGYVRGFSRIPVAVAYGRKTGFLESRPPLLDLALLNISYYQKKSDRDQSLHKCGNPIPLFVGVPEDWNILAAGSGYGIKLPGGASASYMEPQGNALQESREDLAELRGEMAALGLSTLQARPQVAATATESVIDFTQESSELETIARSAADCFESCLGFHARYLGLPSGGSLSLGSHLKSMRLTAQQIQVYAGMAATGDLSRLTLWEIMRGGDALPDTFDPTAEAARLKEQRHSLGAQLLRDFDGGGEGVDA